MEDQGAIFNKVILNQLDAQLISIGYEKEETYKGYFRYRCSNNYLTFINSFRDSPSFSCTLGFDSKRHDRYNLQSVIQKIEGNTRPKKLIFEERTFSARIEEWATEISNQLSKYEIPLIKSSDPIIVELKNKFDKEHKIFWKKFSIGQTKREADRFWNSKKYSSFIRTINASEYELPSSYYKKASIAKKRIAKENNASKDKEIPIR